MTKRHVKQETAINEVMKGSPIESGMLEAQAHRAGAKEDLKISSGALKAAALEFEKVFNVLLENSDQLLNTAFDLRNLAKKVPLKDKDQTRLQETEGKVNQLDGSVVGVLPNFETELTELSKACLRTVARIHEMTTACQDAKFAQQQYTKEGKRLLKEQELAKKAKEPIKFSEPQPKKSAKKSKAKAVQETTSPVNTEVSAAPPANGKKIKRPSVKSAKKVHAEPIATWPFPRPR